MKNLLVFIGLAVFFLNACRSDDEAMAIPPQEPEDAIETNLYSLLTPGNYWVYEVYQDDSNGILVPSNQTDSTYVEKDTLINGINYAKVVEEYLNITTTKFYRDSLNFTIDEKGNKIFSYNSFGELLFTNDITIGTIDHYMRGEENLSFNNEQISVLVREGTIELDDPENFPACGLRPTRWYAKSIGILRTQEHFLGNCNRVRRELVRYNAEI